MMRQEMVVHTAVSYGVPNGTQACAIASGDVSLPFDSLKV